MGPCERVSGDVSSLFLVNVSSHCTREAGHETRSDVAASIDGPFSSTDYLGSFELHRSNGLPPVNASRVRCLCIHGFRVELSPLSFYELGGMVFFFL